MIYRIKHLLKTLREDKEATKNIYLLTIAFAVLMLLIPVRDMLSPGRYIVAEDKSVVELERQTDKESCEYNLVLEIEDRDGVSRQEIKIKRDASGNKTDLNNQDASSEDYSDTERKQLRNMEIDDIIASIESSELNKVKLPGKLSDGSKLKWYKQNQFNSLIGIMILMYTGLVLLLIKNSIDKASKPLQKHRDEIVAVLPRFVNQIVMMMDAGVILSDAFVRISKSYLIINEIDRGYFENSIIRIAASDDLYNRSIALKLSEFAKAEGVKELSRIARILMENERRGSDAQSNLTRESEFLWESRKIVATEKGKSIDTKMTFPLGMLLLLLIVITMAPALMSM